MATNQLQISANLTYNNTLSGDSAPASVQKNLSDQITVLGFYFENYVANILTTDTTLSLGNINTIGYMFLQNLDATNFVTFGPTNSSYPCKLMPGEFALLRWNANAVHCQANVANINLGTILIEA